MAKTTHALFSLTAAGTVAGCALYRKTSDRAVAQFKPMRNDHPTATQTAARNNWRDAAAAWKTLDTQTKADWTSYATQHNRPPFSQFAKEWIIQQIAPPGAPLIPQEPWPT